MALALRDRSSATSRACSSCNNSSFDSRGSSEINETDASAGGMGRSLMALSRDAVVW